MGQVGTTRSGVAGLVPLSHFALLSEGGMPLCAIAGRRRTANFRWCIFIGGYIERQDTLPIRPRPTEPLFAEGVDSDNSQPVAWIDRPAGRGIQGSPLASLGLEQLWSRSVNSHEPTFYLHPFLPTLSHIEVRQGPQCTSLRHRAWFSLGI